MFTDIDLEAALAGNSTLSIQSLVLAEFNLNDLENVEKIGNYKYRTGAGSVALQAVYDPDDVGNFYSDTDLSYQEYKDTDDTNPFIAEDKNPEFFYSLGDCFLPFRPRSGINKARFFSGKYFDNLRSAERPRYYICSRKDYFKYWSSYRNEGRVERGISNPSVNYNTAYTIDDAAPFVVYNNPVQANRIVVKMQTNVGSVDLGTIRTPSDTYINDPLYDYANASVPKHWKIQVLDLNDNWVDAIEFDHTSLRSDLSPIVPKDGTVELFYGIKIPAAYIDTFNFKGYIHQSLLPASGLVGDAYIYGATTTSAGQLVVWNGTLWQSNVLQYGWSLREEDVHVKTNGICRTLVDPLYYTSGPNTIYREFARIRGLRVAVKTMHAPQTYFDLIELSPRLMADLSDYTNQYDITKSLMGDNNGLPVGSLVASNGQIQLSNIDNAFNDSNTFDGINGSIIASALGQNIKFIFYETILDINGADKYIPIKTMYSENFTTAVNGMKDVTIPLRDLFFRLETAPAPTMFSSDTTLTYAVAQVLDYIGFSNYIFKSVDGYPDPLLPYFFVETGMSAAEILNRIAVATQAAMFFDEYNNFVVMTKEYLLPDNNDRPVDIVLSGNDAPLANIEDIEPQETVILNDGQISYTVRYVQREISKLSSAIQLDNERVYRYKPVLLWEVSSNDETKTINQSTQAANGFALGAMALNTSLSASVPYVSGGEIKNNIIDVGESIYWLPRYQGYLYANSEIIKFDAVEYAIPSQQDPLVWITDNQQYQQYFAKLPFNGKIYPTGRVRIFAEPYYAGSGSATYFKDGEVRAHGRGQFGTPIVTHEAGLADYWSDDANTYGIHMYSENLFSTTPTEDLVPPTIGTTPRVETSTINAAARKSTRNGIIKNFMASKVYEDGYVNRLKTTNSGTIQSSALVFRGPRPDSAVPNSRDLVSYVYKDLSANAAFRHFGTRMRIIGKTDQNFGQVANGSADYYAVQSYAADDKISINGGSGGIGIFVDPINGSGYYLEIAALSDDNIEQYSQFTDINGNETAVHNIIFYKVNAYAKQGDGANAKAAPQKMWGGLTNIIVDAGLFAGQDRLGITENNSVYDLAIEYQVLKNGGINFYLYINNILVKVVKDRNPLPIKTSAALFVRASTECMFENIYAIEDVIGRGQNSVLAETGSDFDKTAITTSEFMRKYAISGMIQSTYLTNISPNSPTKMHLYFDEFGTIMRECVYFDIEFDQAYPAFYSNIAKTFTTDRAFTVSGYHGTAYGAEFLVFNSADKAIVLDESTGSYLRILGITFTQNSTDTLTVDGFYNRNTDFSNPQFSNNYLVDPQKAKMDYNKIRASRSRHGNRTFTLDSLYIQSEAQARDIMQWMINKTLKPRKDLIIKTFPMPHVQVGDIATIEYTTPDGIDYIDPSTRFVVKDISYSHGESDISQTLRVQEI